MAEITYCPPAPAAHFENFDRYSFDNRCRQPVSATYERAANGELGFTSTGLAFSDFRRMAVEHKRGSWNRQAPSWVFSTEKVRFIITRAMETRAGILKPPVDLPLMKRFALAQQRLLTRRVPLLEQQIDELCRLYVRVKQSSPENGLYLHTLEVEIANVDTQLLCARHAAGLLLTVLYYAYNCGLDSVSIALLTGTKPPHCRRILKHLTDLAKMQGWE